MGRTFITMVKEAAARKHDDEDKLYKSPLVRALQFGGGAGIIKGNLPHVKAMAKGREELWHGTPAENLFPGAHGPGILQTGLSTDFAGKNKRLNSHLMTNALYRDTEELLASKGVKITPEVEDKLYKLTQDYLGERGSHKNISEGVLSRAGQVAQEFGLDPSEVKAHYEKKLPELGKRLYFGNTPESVAFWSQEGKHEGHYLADMQNKLMGRGAPGAGQQIKANAKIIGEALAEQASGGYFNDIRAKLRYGKPKEKISIKDLSELKSHIPLGGTHDVVFRSSVPTGTIEPFKDLPVFRHVISSVPGLKSTVARYMPQSDPSKDMSIAESVSPKNINRVHVVDRDTGKVLKEINIANAEKTPLQFLGGKGRRFKNLRKMAIPGALTAIGGNMMYNAVTGDDLIDKGKELFTKKSSVNRMRLAKTFAYPAAGILGAGATGIGVRKALGKELPPTITEEEADKMSLADKARFQADELAYGRDMAPINALLMGGAGAGLGALGLKKNRAVGGILGSYFGSAMGTALVPEIIRQANAFRVDPENAGLLTSVAARHKPVRDFIKEHPEETAIGEQALVGGAAAALPYYVAKKYYPYHTHLLKDKILSKVPQALERLKDSRQGRQLQRHAGKAVAASILLPAGLDYANRVVSEQALRGAAAGLDIGKKKEKKK